MATKVYSFKSSGEARSSQREREAQRIKKPPIGIKTPLEFSDGDSELFKMHYEIEKNIADNFKNLIMTNHGERLFDYYFGANLKELVFELGTEDIDQEAIARIQDAVSRYLPYISLNTFESSPIEDNFSTGPTIKIKITYVIPAISSAERAIEIAL